MATKIAMPMAVAAPTPEALPTAEDAPAAAEEMNSAENNPPELYSESKSPVLLYSASNWPGLAKLVLGHRGRSREARRDAVPTDDVGRDRPRVEKLSSATDERSHPKVGSRT
jgi:hypothetical protein